MSGRKIRSLEDIADYGREYERHKEPNERWEPSAPKGKMKFLGSGCVPVENERETSRVTAAGETIICR